MEMEKSYRAILKNKLEERCNVNPSYSLRAFARDLEFNPATLSQVINGRRGLSENTANKICKKLGLSKIESELFINLVLESDARCKEKRRVASAKLVQHRSNINEKQTLQLEYFKVISDWYHFAILELTTLDNFKNSPHWIARKLGLNTKQVEVAIERLLRLELLEKGKDGSLKPSEDFTDVLSGPPSDAVRKFHKQLVEKSLMALYTQSVEERDFSSMLFAFDSAQIKAAKANIDSFGKNFTKNLPETKSKDSVYCLSIQFFRADQKNI